MISVLSKTDLLSSWLDKINAVINTINNLNPTNVFGLNAPVNNQDILVYNSGTGLFTNMPIATFVTSVLTANAALAKDNNFLYFIQNQQTLF